MKLGANFPMGPLALADLVGLDTTKACSRFCSATSATPSTSPARCWQARPAGQLGRKSGAGFFTYG